MYINSFFNKVTDSTPPHPPQKKNKFGMGYKVRCPLIQSKIQIVPQGESDICTCI